MSIRQHPYSEAVPARAASRAWTAGVLFEALAPAVIGIAVLVFLILAFVGASPNYP